MVSKRMVVAALACVTLVGIASLVSAAGSGATPSCTFDATTSTTTCTFSYTGAPEAWTVPAGVTSAVFDVYGAAGGSVCCTVFPGGSGGKGGHVQGTVALTPGSTLSLRVGGSGGDGGAFLSVAPGVTVTIPGGFNGGGTNSFSCVIGGGCGFVMGGAGGGASDVRTAGDGLADRLLVAGGGGGAGVGGKPGQYGNGGNSATAAPSVTNFGPLTCSGGAAGTLLGPGAAGSGTGCTSGSAGSGPSGGGSSVPWLGAGGGGYFGGGAGAAVTLVLLTGSGGGGGSDYPDPGNPPAGISNVTVADGVQSGNGLITVTYHTNIPPVADLSKQLDALKAAVAGVGPEKNLGKQVKKIERYVAAHDTAHACKQLKAFIKQVNALAAGKRISAAQAAMITDLAKDIRHTLGC